MTSVPHIPPRPRGTRLIVYAVLPLALLLPRTRQSALELARLRWLRYRLRWLRYWHG